MNRANILTLPVSGTASSVLINLIGHDHKVARTLEHPVGTGRWIDQYEVRRTGSYEIPEGKVVTPDLAQAVRIGQTFYADAAMRHAEARWASAVKDSAFISNRLPEGA